MKRIVLSMVLIGMLFLVGCQVECPDCVCPEYEECQECEVCLECEECPEEKALISTIFAEWGPSELSDNRAIFDFVIYNYGNIEAKNVIVTCYIENLAGKKLWTKKKSIGNVGSVSENIEELVFELGSFKIDLDDSVGVCYASSCDNCEILELKIPEVKERFE